MWKPNSSGKLCDRDHGVHPDILELGVAGDQGGMLFLGERRRKAIGVGDGFASRSPGLRLAGGSNG